MFINRSTHTIMIRFRAGRVTKPRAVAVVGLEMGRVVGLEEGLGCKCFLLCELGRWGHV